MRIQPVKNISIAYSQNHINNTNIYNANINDSFKGITVENDFSKKYCKIYFMGYPVHIVDGGNHATNVAHFAKAIEHNTVIGREILKRRTEGNAYIGDLYDKYK